MNSNSTNSNFAGPNLLNPFMKLLTAKRIA